MKKLFLVIGLVLASCSPQSESPVLSFSRSEQLTRPGVLQPGGWVEIDCSAGAAYSAALSTWASYVVQAVGGDVYVARATAASGQDADSNDGYVPEGAWYRILTDAGPYYLTCDGSAAVATLRYIEVR